jgi:hypothetical protein
MTLKGLLKFELIWNLPPARVPSGQPHPNSLNGNMAIGPTCTGKRESGFGALKDQIFLVGVKAQRKYRVFVVLRAV